MVKTIAVCPPTGKHASAMERAVPCDDDSDDVGGSGFIGERGGVECARDQGPQAATAESVVLQDTAQEGHRGIDHEWNLHRPGQL